MLLQHSLSVFRPSAQRIVLQDEYRQTKHEQSFNSSTQCKINTALSAYVGHKNNITSLHLGSAIRGGDCTRNRVHGLDDPSVPYREGTSYRRGTYQIQFIFHSSHTVSIYQRAAHQNEILLR